MSVLSQINSPSDVKKCNREELKTLAAEIRQGILTKNSKIGGHMGPNLGIVETTIALHAVFESPTDKIVYDVSHQCYPHKMLTGRKNAFFNETEMGSVSGYTNPAESEHDFFVIGHTSTAVSLATGLAKARDLKGEKGNVIALVGDGSLSGGEAWEGLNNAAVLNSNIIVIVNDNEMSIAENHGGLYTNLRELRDTNGTATNNLFKALGFEYHYVSNGNSIDDMIEALTRVKDTSYPVLLHVRTLKGKGYALAEENKETWHWSVPFDIETGKAKFTFDPEQSYSALTAAYLSQKAQQDNSVVVISAGTPSAFTLTPQWRAQMGANFVDVGIAEEHAVAYSSALAKGGCKPVFMVFSSFIQRTYDQLSQDLALNNNPAVILVFGAGISGGDATHLGVFDIPMIANIPNIIYLAPTGREEYFAMLEWGLAQTEHPVVIRVPATIESRPQTAQTSYNALNTYQLLKKGEKVALLAAGSFLSKAEETAALLAQKGITATIVNPRFLSGVDTILLSKLEEDHTVIATLEDGVVAGGWGEKITRFYGATDMKVLNFGAKKEFTDRIPLQELYQRYHLTPELIAADILKALD